MASTIAKPNKASTKDQKWKQCQLGNSPKK